MPFQKKEADAILDDTAHKVKKALGEAVYGEDDNCLEDAVFDLLKSQCLTIALAESCTGGLTARSFNQCVRYLRIFSGGSGCLF